MKKYLESITIIPDTMNHSYEEMMRSLPPFDESFIWSLDKNDDDVLKGCLKDFDEDGYKVVDELDGQRYSLYELHHWYKPVAKVPDNTNCETSPSRALDHSFQMSNAIS